MLKGLNPLLNAEVLFALRAMGHGDDLIVADTNFPSDSIARRSTPCAYCNSLVSSPRANSPRKRCNPRLCPCSRAPWTACGRPAPGREKKWPR